jgi:hypothetical protein
MKAVNQKSTRLFIILAMIFIANALIAEMIGVKIFSLEPTLGLAPLDWNLFGEKGSLMFTCGVILWPIVFTLTDILNEYFGRKGVRFLSIITACLISYGFAIIYLAIVLTPAGWWVGVNIDKGVPDMQAAFSAIFGQGLWIICGSLVAFLIGQIIDAYTFYKIKKWTGEGHFYLRAILSTIISQFIDSFVVLYIAFVIGPQHWPLSRFFAIGTVNFVYKVLAAILLIPLLGLAHKWIDNYLGKANSDQLKLDAMED